MNPTKAPSARPPDRPASPPAGRPQFENLVRQHLAFGWRILLVFLTMGLVLETLHGLKLQSYLGAHNETRRLMWTLAHAHGTLLGLVNLGFAFMVHVFPEWPLKPRSVASAFLRAATILMPAGFFLGGWFTYSGDPGLGILLVPLGGLLLFAAVLMTARAAKSQKA